MKKITLLISLIIFGAICSLSLKAADVTNVYLVGDFNNWQLPADNDDKGAAKFTPAQKPGYSENEYIDYFALEKTFDAGSLSFALYVTYSDGKSVMYGTKLPPFTLFRRPNYDYEQYWPDYYGEIGDQGYHIYEVKDFSGGKLAFECYPDEQYHQLIINIDNMPVYQAPDKIYAIIQIDDSTPYIQEVFDNETNNWMNYFGPWKEWCGKKLSILFTTENSINPSKEHTYGMSTNTIITGYEDKYLDYVQGGYPYVIENSNFSKYFLRVYLTYGFLNLTTKEVEIPEKIYVIGYQNGWATPSTQNESQFQILENTSEGIFEGDINCPESSDMQFRFMSKLEGWASTYSIGSGEDDFSSVPIDMNEYKDKPYKSSCCMQGLGNWQLVNWAGGNLHFKYDLYSNIFSIGDTSGVSTISVDDIQKVEYYTLQGIKVSEPQNGVYIRVVNGKSEKILIK